MSTSPSSAPSPSISKSEFYSSLPWFRRCLAMLNWRPVVDYELREIEFDRSEQEFEKREIVHEQRMRQLENEDAQLRNDEERDRTARRAQLQNRCALVQLQHQLAPTPEHTQQLRGLIGFLLEYGEFS